MDSEVDRNCDGSVGDADADGDGVVACLDCDDSDSSVTDPFTVYQDNDGDGYGNPLVSTDTCESLTGFVDDSADCNDNDATIHPDASERCNGEDDDCDDEVDEEALDILVWYPDEDGDGYGNEDGTAIEACDGPDYYSDATGDCDDADPSTYLYADEVCDGVDNDCDGEIDDDPTDVLIFFTDADGDGYGDGSLETEACEAPEGTVSVDGDWTTA